MPLAGTHIAITAAVLAAIRKFLKVKFSDRTLLLGAAMGLLPDLDIPAALFLNAVFGTSFYFHKTYTHTFIIPLLLFAAAMALKYLRKGKAAILTLIAATAWLVHLPLDCYLAVGSPPTWIPAMGQAAFCREFPRTDILVLLDASMILLFTIYLAYKSGRKN